MTNCIFYALFFTLFLNISIGSLKYSQIHRTYKAAYKGVFEACSISVDANGEPIVPYYNMTELKNYITDYFEKNLSKYTTDYEVNVKYLTNRNTMCIKSCRRMKLTLNAKINTFYSYSNSEIFIIKNGDNL